MLKLNIFFVIAILITILLMRHEVHRYTDVRLAGQVSDFERRRFTRRMFGAVILALVLLMTYLGYIYRESFSGHYWIFTIYWVCTLGMVFSLFIIAVVDARAILQYNLKKYLDEGDEAVRLEKFLTKEREKTERKTT